MYYNVKFILLPRLKHYFLIPVDRGKIFLNDIFDTLEKNTEASEIND